MPENQDQQSLTDVKVSLEEATREIGQCNVCSFYLYKADEEGFADVRCIKGHFDYRQAVSHYAEGANIYDIVRGVCRWYGCEGKDFELDATSNRWRSLEISAEDIKRIKSKNEN